MQCIIKGNENQWTTYCYKNNTSICHKHEVEQKEANTGHVLYHYLHKCQRLTKSPCDNRNKHSGCFGKKVRTENGQKVGYLDAGHTIFWSRWLVTKVDFCCKNVLSYLFMICELLSRYDRLQCFKKIYYERKEKSSI